MVGDVRKIRRVLSHEQWQRKKGERLSPPFSSIYARARSLGGGDHAFFTGQLNHPFLQLFKGTHLNLTDAFPADIILRR